METEAWIKGPAELIASILDSGDLYVESEITVWHAFQELFSTDFFVLSGMNSEKNDRHG